MSQEQKGPDVQALLAQIQALTAQLQTSKEGAEALRASGVRVKRETTELADKLSCAVSPKGAISIYGLARWPVTLYRHQFERLVAVVPLIQAFAEANAAKLSTRDESKAVSA